MYKFKKVLFSSSVPNKRGRARREGRGVLKIGRAGNFLDINKGRVLINEGDGKLKNYVFTANVKKRT